MRGSVCDAALCSWRKQNVIHQYHSNGYYIVLDVNSGSVHAVDSLVYQLIPFFEKEEDLSTILLFFDSSLAFFPKNVKIKRVDFLTPACISADGAFFRDAHGFIFKISIFNISERLTHV